MAILTIPQALLAAEAAGFTKTGLIDIVAIAMAESGLNTAAKSPPNSDQWGSIDRGILQINSHWHAEVADSCAYDAACAFQAGFRISQGGRDFTPWSTWGNGRAAANIAVVSAALNGQSGTPPSPAPVPSGQPSGP